jgi:hypothetical protein
MAAKQNSAAKLLKKTRMTTLHQKQNAVRQKLTHRKLKKAAAAVANLLNRTKS